MLHLPSKCVILCNISMIIDEIDNAYALLHPFWFVEEDAGLHESAARFQSQINTIGSVRIGRVLFVDAANGGIKSVGISLDKTISRIFIERIIGKSING